jgi:hypothetical protein
MSPPGLRISYVRTQGLLVEFANLFQACLESLVIFQLPLYLRDLFATQTDVSDPPSGIRHGQYRHRMPLPSFTLGAPLTVTDDPLQQRTAQDVGQVGEVAQQLPALRRNVFHVYK